MRSIIEIIIILIPLAILVFFAIGIYADAKDSMHDLYPNDRRFMKEKHSHTFIHKHKAKI